MNKIIVITPVKDSPETTFRTIDGVINSNTNDEFIYTIYNDFSSKENTNLLASAAQNKKFSLVNLEDITSHPSPNYLLILQQSQKQALSLNAHLLLIESDVIVEPETIQKLSDKASELLNAGLIASVTIDENGEINFPYLYASKYKAGTIETQKRLSFCCTLITNNFLKEYDFSNLNPEKSWYDVFISHKSTELGFKNYLLTDLPVIHLPHSSRPWKKLKYTNPLKYYWKKFIHNKDKI